MSNIDFFIPVSFDKKNRTYFQYFQQKIDSYFYLGGKTVRVYGSYEEKMGYTVFMKDETQKQNRLVCAIKIISYTILPLSATLLIAKAAFRHGQKFSVKESL